MLQISSKTPSHSQAYCVRPKQRQGATLSNDRYTKHYLLRTVKRQT